MPLFPPRKRPGGKLRHKGVQSVSHVTVNGEVRLRRIYWRSPESGRDDMVDRIIGMAADRVSAGVRQMCCQVGIIQQGFARGAKHLKHLAQLAISRERLRNIVESEGMQVCRMQQKGLLSPGFDAADCRVGKDGPSRIYVGADGVKVPMVTEKEKDKRRKNRRPKRSGGKRRRMHKGADNAYKEFKIATMYDESNEHKHVFATSGNHEVLGKLLRRQAAKLGLTQFDQKVGLADGADWITKQFRSRLPMLDVRILDFYHLSEHIWSAANVCFGQGTDQAGQFAGEILHIAKHQGPTALLDRLMAEHKKYRSKAKRKSLGDLIRYIAKRFEMCDYPKFTARGWQIGSGPTEAMCKVLTYRLKGPGMRWDRPAADAIMALIALQQSNSWKGYWRLQKQAG